MGQWLAQLPLATVPEPGALTLIATAISLSFIRRRPRRSTTSLLH